jgi:hypothetical protein
MFPTTISGQQPSIHAAAHGWLKGKTCLASAANSSPLSARGWVATYRPALLETFKHSRRGRRKPMAVAQQLALHFCNTGRFEDAISCSKGKQPQILLTCLHLDVLTQHHHPLCQISRYLAFWDDQILGIQPAT